MCVPTLKFYSVRTKGHMRVIGCITSTKKTHLKLTKTLKVCLAKRDPALIGNHRTSPSCRCLQPTKTYFSFF
jgi:hypothetical protein